MGLLLLFLLSVMIVWVVLLIRLICLGKVLWKKFEICSVMLMCGWLSLVMVMILKLIIWFEVYF